MAKPSYCSNNLVLEFRAFGVDNELGGPVPLDRQPGTPESDPQALACTVDYDPGPGRDLRLIPPGSTQVRVVVYEYDPTMTTASVTLQGMLNTFTGAGIYRPDPSQPPIGYRSDWLDFLITSHQQGFIRATSNTGLGSCYQTPSRALGVTGPCT